MSNKLCVPFVDSFHLRISETRNLTFCETSKQWNKTDVFASTARFLEQKQPIFAFLTQKSRRCLFQFADTLSGNATLVFVRRPTFHVDRILWCTSEDQYVPDQSEVAMAKMVCCNVFAVLRLCGGISVIANELPWVTFRHMYEPCVLTLKS